MRKMLGPDFFDRPTLTVAEELVGKFLVRRVKRKRHAALEELSFMITETEAYDGFRDKASHASRGQTPRNTPMFGPAGAWYVYFVYGMHDMLNIVTGPREHPAAVLIRGVEGINGPGKLTRELSIDRKLNAKSATSANGLWIEDRGTQIYPKDIKRTPRVGVTYAGKWADKQWRFVLKTERRTHTASAPDKNR